MPGDEQMRQAWLTAGSENEYRRQQTWLVEGGNLSFLSRGHDDRLAV